MMERMDEQMEKPHEMRDFPFDLKVLEPEAAEYLARTRRDVSVLLREEMPAEGEDYGPWTPQMEWLLYLANEKWATVQLLDVFAYLLRARTLWAVVLLFGERDSDGILWTEELEDWARWKEADEDEQRRFVARARPQWTGDRVADEILKKLHQGQYGRRDLYVLFNRNVSAEQLDKALFLLHRQGRITVKLWRTAGRPREVWMLWKDEYVN
jgi:hypothetical protein